VCPDPSEQDNMTACLGDPPAGAFAEVHTATVEEDGTTLLPPYFAQLLTGADPGTEVGACARVAWGPPRSVEGLALAVSQCEWQRFVATGGEQAIRLHDSHPVQCGDGTNAPGNYGWLDDPSDVCTVTAAAGQEIGGSTNLKPPGACGGALDDLLEQRRPIPVPLYGLMGDRPGQNATYWINGFGAFVLTGYRFNSKSVFADFSELPANLQCTGSEKCLYGYFTEHILPTTGAEIGGTDFGTSIINLVG